MRKRKPLVYLAGQFSQYDKGWKENLKKLDCFDFYDPETDSNQSSPDNFFPQDLRAVKNAKIMVANPGIAPSEAMWIEVGYFLASNTSRPGEKCEGLIIIWKAARLPEWSIKFVEKCGILVRTIDEAVKQLLKLKGE